jgi:hypothetical protein
MLKLVKKILLRLRLDVDIIGDLGIFDVDIGDLGIELVSIPDLDIALSYDSNSIVWMTLHCLLESMEASQFISRLDVKLR